MSGIPVWGYKGRMLWEDPGVSSRTYHYFSWPHIIVCKPWLLVCHKGGQLWEVLGWIPLRMVQKLLLQKGKNSHQKHWAGCCLLERCCWKLCGWDLPCRGEAGKEPPGAFSWSLSLILSSDVALKTGPNLTIPAACPFLRETDGSLA